MSTGIPCPRCRAPLQSGARICGACGSHAIVEKKEGEDAPTCAAHPTRLASAACVRCGVFGCATCLVSTANGVLCRTCRPPVRVPPAIAWENTERSLPLRFVSTAWAFLFHPMSSASAVQSGSVLRAWGFAALCFGFLAAWGEALLQFAEQAHEPETMVVTAIVISVIWLLVLPLSEYALLRILGEEVSFTAQLRATAYASAAFAFPVCGWGLLFAWAPLLRLLTVRSAFEVPWMHALVATTTLPILCTCAIIASRLDLTLWV